MIDLKNTAVKVEISDIVKGEIVKTPDNQIFIKTARGELSNVRILATIVDKFISEDKNFAVATLDDATDTIRIRCFKDDVRFFNKIEPGDIIDVIGRVREYEDEIYVQPSLIVKITDPNFELLRKLELFEEKKIPRENLDELALKKIKELDTGNGVQLSELTNNIKGFNENEITVAVRNLMMRGDVFEPKKGVLKVVE